MFMRDDSWNETNYFLEQAGLDTEPLDRQDYGFTLGGPIKQDKLHFFLSAEWNQEERGIARAGFVPTAAERAGDFSGPSIPGCTPAIPTDPTTGQPFPGNVIPGDRINAGGQGMLNLYPLPNVTAGRRQLQQLGRSRGDADRLGTGEPAARLRRQRPHPPHAPLHPGRLGCERRPERR